MWSLIILTVVLAGLLYLIYNAGGKTAKANRDMAEAKMKEEVADKIISFSERQREIDEKKDRIMDWTENATSAERAELVERLFRGDELEGGEDT